MCVSFKIIVSLVLSGVLSGKPARHLLLLRIQ